MGTVKPLQAPLITSALPSSTDGVNCWEMNEDLFRYVEPEVAGFMGDQTVVDLSTHPPIVYSLDYQLDSWLGDDLLETFPCFVVTERLKQAIEAQALTGVIFDSVIISRGKTFSKDRLLPTFHWLKVVGTPRKDDFGIAEDYRLIVSDEVYTLLRRFNILKFRFQLDQ